VHSVLLHSQKEIAANEGTKTAAIIEEATVESHKGMKETPTTDCNITSSGT
jgi:hypothetical protein